MFNTAPKNVKYRKIVKIEKKKNLGYISIIVLALKLILCLGAKIQISLTFCLFEVPTF